MKRMMRAVAAASLAGALLFAPGCSTNPATGKKIIAAMSRDDEIRLGSEAAPQFTQEFGGAVPSPQLQQYVAGIGRKMAAETEADNPSLPWEFTLLNTDVINAFALPGGKVFFTRGLAKELTTEAQMAGVLGHEIGHVTAQHANQRMSQAGILEMVVQGAAVAAGTGGEGGTLATVGQYGVPAISAGGQVMLLKYGRDQESEADSLGMRYMSNVGYTPRGQLEVMQVLARLSGAGAGPEFFATHPYPETRIERIKQELDQKYAAMLNNPNYGEFADRYKAQFLDPLSKLPPPPPPPQPKQGKTVPSGEQALALSDPAGVPNRDERRLGASSWCGVCAAAEGRTARGMLASAALRYEQVSR